MAKTKPKAKAAAKPKASPARKDRDPAPAPKYKTYVTDSGIPRAERLDAVTASLHKGGTDVIGAEELYSSYLLRRPTGIISIDIALGGGFPASTPCVIVGPDGAGKDYLFWCTCAETQQLYGEDFAMAIYLTESRLDKPYMRDICGFKVAMSEKELEEHDKILADKGLPPMTDEDRARYQEQVGRIYIIIGVTAEDGLDAAMAYIESNACQIVAVNSLGFFQTNAKEDQDSFSTFAQQRNEAILISKFMPKLAMTLNKDVAPGERNETLVLLLNQMRSKDNSGPRMPGRPVLDRDKYKPASEAWALKHGKMIEFTIHNGAKKYDEGSKPPQVVGREKPWEITKGKFGTHEGIKGVFDYYFEFGADKVGDLVTTCKALGVFEGVGWMTYDHPELGFKVQGDEKARRHLQDNPELVAHLREECFKRSGITYRHR